MRAKNTIGQFRKCMHVKGLFKHAVCVCEGGCAYLYQGYIPYGQGYSASRVSSRSIKERRTFTFGGSGGIRQSYERRRNPKRVETTMAEKEAVSMSDILRLLVETQQRQVEAEQRREEERRQEQRREEERRQEQRREEES